MSTCNHPGCQNNKNIWRISCTRTYPPFFQDFTLCNDHLFDGCFYTQIRDVLINERYHSIISNTVERNGWKLDKLIETWENKRVKCCECGSNNCIWKYVNWSEQKYVCDMHFGEKLLYIKDDTDEFRHYEPIEETWTIKPKKRKRDNTKQSKKRKIDDTKQQN